MVGPKAERLMMYPEQWGVGEKSSTTGRLLAKARDGYRVRFEPIKVQHLNGAPTGAERFAKLLAFNQTRYKRVLRLHSNATVLKPRDKLFGLPSAPLAMPRAYWLDNTLSAQLVLQPSEFGFKGILEAFEHRGSRYSDMEIVKQLYGEALSYAERSSPSLLFAFIVRTVRPCYPSRIRISKD